MSTKTPIAASMLAIGMASISPSNCVAAGNAPVYFGDAVHLGDRTPTKDEVIHLLQPKPAVKMRSIRLRPAEPAITEKTKPAAISMQITFSFNSDELSPRALEQLKPVAEALASRELSGLRFLVEGH